MKSLAAALSLVASLAASAAAQTATPAQEPQPKPTFKSSVDLVPVDVNVLDRSGRPVADLTAQDFSLKVDGKARRIAMAQFIAVTRNVEQSAPPADYSTNPPSAGGRLIMIVVDQGNIGTARGKYAIESAPAFHQPAVSGRPDRPDDHSRRGPADRFHGQPRGGPDGAAESCRAMGSGRASGQPDWIERSGGSAAGQRAGDPADSRSRVHRPWRWRGSRELPGEAGRAGTQTLHRPQIASAGFARVAESRDGRLARTQTPKTVVFLSEGLLLERGPTEISWLGPLAARGQVTLYVLQLEPPVFEATGVQNSPTRSADIQLGHDGLGILAGVARGSLFKVVTGADNAFSRLATGALRLLPPQFRARARRSRGEITQDQN